MKLPAAHFRGFALCLLITESAAVNPLQESNFTSPLPNTTYPNATDYSDPAVVAGARTNQTSPPWYPSPWASGMGDWSAAYARARAMVSQMTLLEKVNLTTGVGYVCSLTLCVVDSPIPFLTMPLSLQMGV